MYTKIMYYFRIFVLLVTCTIAHATTRVAVLKKK